MKITTADCRKFLTTNPKCRKVWLGRYNPADYEDEDPSDLAWVKKVIKNAANPNKWKRVTKYKVGSETGLDAMGRLDSTWVTKTLGFQPQKHDVVREFTLQDTDHCTIAVLEHNGMLHYLDDLSD